MMSADHLWPSAFVRGLCAKGDHSACVVPGKVPDSLADENGLVVLNPSAIGNPDEQPRVWVGADLRALLNPCDCGGVNGYHRDDCEASS